MQAERILEKAQKLGLSINENISTWDNLELIANQVGLSNFNPETDLNTLENILISEENRQNNSNYNNDYRYENSNTNKHFGQKEYNATKNENGVYDKNYYKNKDEELNKKVEDAEKVKNEKAKEVPDLDGKETTEGIPTKKVSKTFGEKTKDNINLQKAKMDRFNNKLNRAKAASYNMAHPGEALKDRAAGTVKEGAKKAVSNVGKATVNTGKAVGKATASGLKALVKVAAAHPLATIMILAIIAIILLIIFMFASKSNPNLNENYDSSCDFNNAIISTTNCESGNEITYKLSEYVTNETYKYTKDNSYNEEFIKSLMLIIKTNTLSTGNYSSGTSTININSCVNYELDDNNKDIYNNYYEELYDYLYLDKGYSDKLSSLSANDSLTFDFEDLKNKYNGESYIEFLNKYYNKDTNYSNNENHIALENIYIGDSRTHGMVNYGIIDRNKTIYGSSYGFNWFVGNGSFSSDNTNALSGAINGANNIMDSNKNYNIIIWLGINDIFNLNKYYEQYKYLAESLWQNNNIYIISLGPVDDSKSKYVKNSDVSEFNNKMENFIRTSQISNLKYVNLGYTEGSIVSYDQEGIHYSKEDYQQIAKIISDKIHSKVNKTGEYSLYNLSNYCAKYTNLTENDLWWWPIGSRETTIKDGKKYALGNPDNTRINAYFNGNDNVHKGNHSGIDLDGEKNVDNVIAAKSGKVIYPKLGDNISHGDGSLNESGYGNYVKIDHGDGVISIYGHMYKDTITVFEGDYVEQGQVIGKVGTSGRSTGPHLHFEIRVNNVPVNPLEYVNPENPRPILTNVPKGVELVSGTDSKNIICRSLINEGLSQNAVAGLMANFVAESSFIPYLVQNDFSSNYKNSIEYTNKVDNGSISKNEFVNNGPGGGGYGLAQWTYPTRKSNLYDTLKSQKLSISDLQGQLNFVFTEVDGMSNLKKYMTGNYSAYDIANQFCLIFERPENLETNCPKRANNHANNMLNYVKNGCQ